MARRPAISPISREFLVVVALIGLVTGSLPRSAAAEPADVAPKGETEVAGRVDLYPPPSTRTKLVLAGVATTAAWYGLALGASYAWPDTVGAKDLRIPVAGPWQALSHSGCGGVSSCSTVIVVLRAIATTIDAIGQAGGLAVVAEGLFLPTREPQHQRAKSWPNGFTLRPTVDTGKNSVGFGVLGVF